MASKTASAPAYFQLSAARNGSLRNRSGDARPTSLRFEARGLHDLAPLLGFIGDELAEFSGSHGGWDAAQIGQPRLHPGVGERRIDFLVELGDDFGGRVLGRADAIPL